MKRLSGLSLLTCIGAMVLSAASDRIVERVDLGRTAAVRGNRHSQAIPQNDRGLADPSTPLRYVTLMLQPAAGLDAFLAEQQTPSSPNYHRWLTPEQFADRFGLSANDVGKLTAWLQGAGLTVHDVARGRHWITFSGSVDQLGRALHTEFHRYQVNGKMRVANAGEPSVPAAFADVIAGFRGLDDFPAESWLVNAEPKTTSGSTHFLAPDDFATIYDVKPLYAAGIDGTGVKIAVAGQSAIDIGAVQAFRRFFNLPANDPQVVLYGSDPGTTTAQTEAYLDLEWSGAVARNASIVYVYGTSAFTAAQYAVDQNVAPILTVSFGTCEQNIIGMRSVAQQANAQGITWMTASGDAGAATCDYFYSPTPQASLGPTLSAPASFPEITAVGGTQFNEGSSPSTFWASRNDGNSASALSYIPEVVWNTGSQTSLKHAATGGPSSFYAKPWWQIGTPDDKVRDVPDVSLSAGTHDAYLVATSANAATTGFPGIGGTSASSPAFAGMVALLTHYLMKQGLVTQPGLGNINPALYRLAQATTDVFHDIVGGDNTVPCVQGSPQCVNGLMGYAATPGYDLATGLGTVDAFNLVMKWATGTASTTVLTADATTVARSANVTLTATVTGGKAQPTGTVTFVSGDATLGTANLTAGAASVSVPATLAVFAPIYALYSGDAVYNASSGSTSVSLDTSGGHSVVVPFVSPNPVPQAGNGSWPYVVSLSEKAGVATKITGFTVNGANNSANIAALGGGNIPAHGTVSASLVGSLTSFPLDRTFVFTGQDADGTTWTQQLTVTFGGPSGTYFVPALGLTSTPGTVEQNPQADSTCQWKQDLTIEERSGFLTQLTRFTVGTADFTGQIQTIFGTTRIAPYGRLRGTMCWASTNTVPGGSKTFSITGTGGSGLTATASATASYPAAPGSTAALSASSPSVELTTPDSSHNASATLDLTFTGASPSWQVSILPANPTASWLQVSPLSGTGTDKLNLQASASGLSAGAYQALISVSAPGSIPEYLNIPVTLVVGASSAKIAGVVNAASFQPAAAPGMLAAVYGTGLSNATATASTIPLPFQVSGVSATVNGVSAPIWGTYPASGQVNLQIPYEAGSGPAVLAINNNGVVSYSTFQIAAAAPGLFGIWDATGNPLTSVKQGQVAVAYITGDGDVSPFLATGATPLATTPLTSLPKARLPLAISVGGMDAGRPLFYGTPTGFVGVTQINFTVPANAPLGKQDVVVTVGGVASNAVSLTVTGQ